MRKRLTYGLALALTVGIACVLGSSAIARSTYAPMITKFSPTSGAPGTIVHISGSHLSGAAVLIGNTPVMLNETKVNAAGTKILVRIPDGSYPAGGKTVKLGPNRVGVMTTSGWTISGTKFVVKRASPSI